MENFPITQMLALLKLVHKFNAILLKISKVNFKLIMGLIGDNYKETNKSNYRRESS
jgi:hypothetical protein